MKVTLVKPDNTVELVEIDGSLQSFQDLVGGYIQYVPIRFSLDDDGEPLEPITSAFCNEDGKLLGLPLNRLANQLCHEVFKIGLAPNDHIVGNMVFFGSVDADGNDPEEGGHYDIQPEAHQIIADHAPDAPLRALKELIDQIEGIGIEDWHGAEGFDVDTARRVVKAHAPKELNEQEVLDKGYF
jgi:hypothetical protein